MPGGWSWWNQQSVTTLCVRAFQDVENLQNTDIGKKLSIKRHIEHYMKNTNNTKMCFNGFSDIFYVPTQYKDVFIQLSDIFVNQKVYLEVAVPMIFGFLDEFSNISPLQKTVVWGNTYDRTKAFYDEYSYGLDYIHPLKLNGILNQIFFKNIILSLSNKLIQQCSDKIEKSVIN